MSCDFIMFILLHILSDFFSRMSWIKDNEGIFGLRIPWHRKGTDVAAACPSTCQVIFLSSHSASAVSDSEHWIMFILLQLISI